MKKIKRSLWDKLFGEKYIDPTRGTYKIRELKRFLKRYEVRIGRCIGCDDKNIIVKEWVVNCNELIAFHTRENGGCICGRYLISFKN